MQMMAAAGRREFDVLIISESSRLGREQIETAFLLKQLDMCGVKVVSCLDGRELLITTPMDKMLRSIKAFADEQERESARQRTHNAMVRKARLGHVTGGRVFGYNNVPVYAPGAASVSAKPLYKVHQINEAEAVVVRRIFDMAGEGYSLHAIATIHVRSRSHGKRRAHLYGCSSYHKRGTKVCGSGTMVAMAEMNAAVINQLDSAVFNEVVVLRTVERCAIASRHRSRRWARCAPRSWRMPRTSSPKSENLSTSSQPARSPRPWPRS